MKLEVGGMRHLRHDEPDPLLHDPGDKADLSREPVQLGDQQLGGMTLCMCDRFPQLRAAIDLARLGLDEFRYQLILSVEEISNLRSLCSQAEARSTLRRCRHPKISGKTGVREVVARTPDVKGYLRRILDLRLAELTTDDFPKPVVADDSLIFCHPDGSPVGSFKKSFLSLIRLAGVERDSHGQLRTIYSLRHTYATFRLHEGVHQFILARNMGTSVAMLEQYYGHTGNVTTAAELTKTAKKRQTGGRVSGLNWLK